MDWGVTLSLQIQAFFSMSMIYTWNMIRVLLRDLCTGTISKLCREILSQEPKFDLTWEIFIELRVYMRMECCLEYTITIRIAYQRPKKDGTSTPKLHTKSNSPKQINKTTLIQSASNHNLSTIRCHLPMRFNRKMNNCSLHMTSHIHIAKIFLSSCNQFGMTTISSLTCR